ncbi:hypothetical protein BGZ60DRAFT_26587 [Tricladium varicosporioides]|nr:hypothetical protein BGZ60DRAFT_26587 [Hymenoscyphus varicosporioides]
MPFNELQRRDSWPPTILRIRDEDKDTFESEIDANPFSFFLTSPDDIEDLDFLDDEDLSAGIETSSSKPSVREVSPSSLQRIPLPKDEEESGHSFMPLTLRDFAIKHTTYSSGRKSRVGNHKDLGLGITFPEYAAMRGRPRVRLTSSIATRGRGRARSWSARRAQSWREPSPDIFTINEEREHEEHERDMEKLRGGSPKIVITPASSDDDEPARKNVDLSPKPKKRVHWAV